MVMMVLIFLSSFLFSQDDAQVFLLTAIPGIVDEFDTFSDRCRLSEDFKKNSHDFLKQQIFKIIGITEADRKLLLDPKTKPEDVAAIRYKIGAQRNTWNKYVPQLRKALKDPVAFIDSVNKYTKKIQKFVPKEWFAAVDKWINSLKDQNLDAFKEWTKATITFVDNLTELSQKYVELDLKVLALTTEDIENWLRDAQEPVATYAQAIHDTMSKPFEDLLTALKSQEPAIIDFPALKNSLDEEVDRLKSRSKLQDQPPAELQNSSPSHQKKTTDLSHEAPGAK
jgi:hypothetical protein